MAHETISGAGVNAEQARSAAMRRRASASDIANSIVYALVFATTVALVTVRFEADIAAVTRNKDGEVVAGSLSDAVQTRDRWTFRRDVSSQDPNWLLVETDEDE